MMDVRVDPASFRDPSGFVYRASDGCLYRQVNRSYEPHFRQLVDSGLYAKLVAGGLLLEHDEVSLALAASSDAARVLRPRELPFISYAYEWPFSALQDAALLTLDIQLTALDHGMTLKDASAYNIQFEGTQPILIDSLSFEEYKPGAPWVAYSQFCRHFLAPLALASKTDIRLSQLLRLYLDGVPLDLASRLLPFSTRFRPGMLVHVHLLARMVRTYSTTPLSDADATREPAKRKVSPKGLRALVENLRRVTSGLRWRPRGTEWAEYYQEHAYDEESFDRKKAIVQEFLVRSQPAIVWDLGANTGIFSRLSRSLGARTYAFDMDPACVERNYLEGRHSDDRLVQPLVLDLTNPSPALGWAHAERRSLGGRGPADVVLALALIHHLAISNNLPFDRIATYFRQLGRQLIIEFVPKTDPQVKRLLQSREDIFDRYTQADFESAFGSEFSMVDRQAVGTTGRVIYYLVSTP